MLYTTVEPVNVVFRITISNSMRNYYKLTTNRNSNLYLAGKTLLQSYYNIFGETLRTN